MTFEALHRRDERIASTSANRCDEHQRTALHGAHSLREFQSLVSQGLFPDLRDDSGETPIDSLFGDVANEFSAHRRTAALNGTLVGASLLGLGSNANWQLGNANDSVSTRPRKSAGVSDIVAVASSAFHSLALTRHGAAICGSDSNSVPRLGRGAGVRTLLVFESIGSLRRVIRVAVTDSRSAVVTASNEVFAWGHGPHGQLGIDDGVTTASMPTRVPIAGAAIDVALSATHTVVATDSDLFLCGRNTHCQLGFADTDAVLWKPRAIVSFHGQCAHMIAANSTATVVVFGPPRPVVVLRTDRSQQAASQVHDEYSDMLASDNARVKAGDRVELRRPVPSSTDNQRIWVIGCSQVLPERMYLGKPFSDNPYKQQAPAPPAVEPGQWQQVQAPQKKAIADRERASCASIAVNDDLIAFVTVDGALYVAPTGTARLARRCEVPLRLAGVSLRARHRFLALTDAGNVYEFDWSYSPCAAWAGRLERQVHTDAAAVVGHDQHSLVVCGTAKRAPRRVQVPIDFSAVHAAPTDLTLTTEGGETVRVHAAVLNRTCPYFAAMTSSSMLETQLATIAVDAALLPTQLALAFIYCGGRSLFERAPHNKHVSPAKKKDRSVASSEADIDGDNDSDDADDAGLFDRDAATNSSVQSISVQLNAGLLSELLQLADMWLMADLSDVCVQLIGEQLTMSNVFDFVELAEALMVDVSAPHPLLFEIATFVKRNAPLILSSSEFLAANPQRLSTVDRVIFGDDTEPDVWRAFSRQDLLQELQDVQERQRLLKRLKLVSTVDERIASITKELVRRGVRLPEPTPQASRAKPAVVAEAPPQQPPTPQQPPQQQQQQQEHDEDTFLDKAAEEFLENSDEAVPVVPAVDSPARFDIRAQLNAAKSTQEGGGGKSKMPRWRKNSESRPAPPRQQQSQASPWRTEQNVAKSPSSLTAIQNEQFCMSPDDPNDVFSSLPAQHTFSQVASGSPPRPGFLAAASSPPTASSRHNNNKNSSSMKAIMDAEASATLAAEMQAMFDREAAEEAWQVAQQIEAAEREQAIHNRRNAHLNSNNNRRRGGGNKGGAK
jgi:hypothetical protein